MQALRVSILLAVSGTLAACASEKDDPTSGVVKVGEFRKADQTGDSVATTAPASAADAGGVGRAPVQTVRTVPVATPAMVGATLPTAAVAMAPIARVSSEAVKVGDPIIVESLVGQINGKPVFAGEFLKPLDKNLAAKAASSKTGREWVTEAKRITGTALMTQLQDELFLAEARATLTKEERAGLLNLVSKLRENLTTTTEGSQELANERLMAEEGKTLEEKATDERDKILIRTLVSRYISPRVNISWRDVQREYARNYDTYNPAPTATLRMIWVPRKETGRTPEVVATLAARATDVSAKLAAGEKFADLAKDRTLNDFNAGEGGFLASKSFDSSKQDAKLVEDPKVNEKAVALRAGEFAGPIESGNRLVWVFMETIDNAPARDLAEVQLEISSALREKKFGEETSRFINRLIERGSKTDLTLMNERLLLIAADRYSGKIGTARAATAPGTVPGGTVSGGTVPSGGVPGGAAAPGPAPTTVPGSTPVPAAAPAPLPAPAGPSKPDGQ